MRFAQCAWNARIVCDGCNNKCRDFHRTGQLISLQNIPPLTHHPILSTINIIFRISPFFRVWHRCKITTPRNSLFWAILGVDVIQKCALSFFYFQNKSEARMNWRMAGRGNFFDLASWGMWFIWNGRFNPLDHKIWLWGKQQHGGVGLGGNVLSFWKGEIPPDGVCSVKLQFMLCLIHSTEHWD